MATPIKLFIPILDNGQGDIKADFLADFFAATSGREITLVRFSDSHPGRGRNIVAAAFLRSACTHLLFIDGDIGFTRANMDRMFEVEAAIVGGIYPLKCPTETKLCLQTLPGHTATETGGLLPVARTGTGWLRIAREVFERMIVGQPLRLPTAGGAPALQSPRYQNHGLDEWDFFQSGVLNGEWLSEDWYFCDRARALGFPVLVDTSIQLFHEGSIKYPLVHDAKRLELCPADMTGHIERIWTGGPERAGEYAIPLDPPPATVLDLGANIGGFTEWACEQWPAAIVAAYEPHPDNATLFRLNTRHRQDRVSLHVAGVRASPGMARLLEGGNCGEASFIAQGTLRGISIWCERAAALGSYEFVKIDTEGCEREILETLDLSATRAVALEYHSAADRTALAALLDSRGFAERAHESLTADTGILHFTRKP